MASGLLKEICSKESLNSLDNENSSVVVQSSQVYEVLSDKTSDISQANACGNVRMKAIFKNEIETNSTNIFNYDFMAINKRPNQLLKPAENRIPLMETQVQHMQNQQPMSHPGLNPDMSSVGKDFLTQSYPGIQQQMVSASGYTPVGRSFPGPLIPPVLVQAPMAGPTTIPGVFQTGYMYQTLPEPRTFQPKSHYFAPFTKGSLIMLSTGGLKPIEELKTVDFVESANVSNELSLETCKIAKIQEVPNSTITLIGFAVENYEKEVMVEKPSDHPFYVYNQGWASCKPEATLAQYGLSCQQLRIGDVCVFLSDRPKDGRNESNSLSVAETRTSTNEEAGQGSSNSFPLSSKGKDNGVENTQNFGKRTLETTNTGSVLKGKQYENIENSDHAMRGQLTGKKAKLDVVTT